MTTQKNRKPIGNETSVNLTIKGEQAQAVRGDDGMWSIVPARLAVSKANSFRHLRDVRSAVRKVNRTETAIKILSLELVDNGESAKSLIDDHGKIWATGSGSNSILRSAGFAAQAENYTHLLIGTQSYEVARLVNL